MVWSSHGVVAISVNGFTVIDHSTTVTWTKAVPNGIIGQDLAGPLFLKVKI